jgi:phosphorylcholine metabolism protein LicD
MFYKKLSSDKVRIRTQEELKIRKYEFLKICEILDNLAIRYFLQGGILLGAIRHNGFIPWDWDVEISVYSDEVIHKMDLLLSEISASGFSVIKHNKELSKLKIDFKGKLPDEVTGYTIFGWSHDENRRVFWRRKIKIPDHFMNNMELIELFGKYHTVPSPPEEYLVYQYGDWKTPIQTSDKSRYLTKEFSGISILRDWIEKIENRIRRYRK